MNKTETLKMAAEIRKLTITAMESIGYGHIGGSMSICEMLAVLYNDIMDVDPKNPKDPNRDYLVLSKGHCGPAVYGALALKGFISKDELKTLNHNGTNLPSHCNRLKTNGVDITTGSLGQGLSLGAGVAMGKKLQCLKGMVFVIVGDGELQEGQIWEAVQFLAHQKLNNLVVIVDNNRRQLDGFTKDVCNPFDLSQKFKAFGFDAIEADGHCVEETYKALSAAKAANTPTAVILNTEKGYGCNFSEIPGFNHFMTITKEMADSAKEDINRRLALALKL